MLQITPQMKILVADVRLQQLLTVFRDPHKVVLQVETRMSGPSIVLHHSNVLEVVA